MSEEKYPAEIVETVAKALHAHDWPEYTWGPPAEEALRERFRERAAAALDALGLTVGEQFHVDYRYGVSGYGAMVGDNVEAMVERQRSMTFGRFEVQRTQRRTFLYAETPWVEVES